MRPLVTSGALKGSGVSTNAKMTLVFDVELGFGELFREEGRPTTALSANGNDVQSPVSNVQSLHSENRPWTLDFGQDHSINREPYKFARMKSVIIILICFTSTGSFTPCRDFG